MYELFRDESNRISVNRSTFSSPLHSDSPDYLNKLINLAKSNKGRNDWKYNNQTTHQISIASNFITFGTS